MNSRNIKSHLRNKFNDWLSSIEDSKLVERIKQDTIITGGAITSLLLSQKPSDYDIYFDNFETAVRVTEYYAKRIKSQVPVYVTINDYKMPIKDINSINFNEFIGNDNRIKLIIKSSGIASTEEADSYKFFEQILDPDNVDVEKYIEELTGKLEQDKENKQKYQPIFASSSAITLSNRIQIITRFYGQPSVIHESFDFQHCKNHWRSSDGYLYLDNKALECIINKQLVYTGSLYPLASMFRLRKFLEKGWYINVVDMLKIGYQISELNLNDVQVLEDQLIGVDVAYFSHLIKALKEAQDKDPEFNMGFHYLSSLLERVF